ncbi:PHB depolymerase family esterase [Xylariaceae sp. FL0804]|nr:PHB depolymerase family esterase [Xylariaceae sp. FL0804]
MPSQTAIRGALALLLAQQGRAALTTVTDFGDNPTSLEMQIYLPDPIPDNPAVVLAMHGCYSTGETYHEEADYDDYADSLGFITIYPTATSDSNCWDVASNASLTHNGGGDSYGLVSMVNYLVDTYDADPSRVFATGSSSGCMMTNVLLGAYPDVFAAGSCYSGIASTCLEGSPGSSPTSANQSCAEGLVTYSGEEWAARVQAQYPGYTGEYPPMQLFHGTSDFVVWYHNFGEELKEWSTLFGVEWSSNVTDTPETGYTKMIYGDGTKLVGYSAVGVGHTVPVHQDLDMAWFGLS